MAITRKRKEALVTQYKELIERSDAIFLADYTGLSVKDMEALRKEAREANGVFQVTKNTLLELALTQANRQAPLEILTGQIGSGFALEGVPPLAKALVDFAEETDSFILKGGILGDKFLTVEEVEALAKLPTLDELRAQIIGLINAPAQNVVSTVTNGVRQLINVVDAYAKSEESADAA